MAGCWLLSEKAWLEGAYLLLVADRSIGASLCVARQRQVAVNLAWISACVADQLIWLDDNRLLDSVDDS
jgi:hypothetical protein